MKINNLKLTNFRNHKNTNLAFSPSITVIEGANGAGKTNILEAINLIATTKSFKARYDKDLINHNADFCRIEGTISKNEDEYNLECTIMSKKAPLSNNDEDNEYVEKEDKTSIKKVKINKVAKSLNNFAGTLNTVLFSPEHIDILTGSPGGRRKYMDMVLFQVDKDYKRATSSFVKAVRQRNKVLELIRETNKGWVQIDFWDDKVVETAEVIQKARNNYFEFIKSNVYEYGKQLNTQETNLDIKYKPNIIDKKRIEEYRSREIAAKTTLIGPHRDDMEIYMNGFDIAEFGSRGQQRSVVLALKLAEIDFFTQVTHEKPILLLDDIFSEFDDKHKQAVTETIKGNQTIITTAEDVNFNFDFEKITL